jgi:hypothetical protein
MNKAHPQNSKNIEDQKNNQIKNKEISNSSTVIIDEDKLLNYYLCPECRPSSTDKIIAKT